MIVEPVEELVIDVPEDHQGVVIAQVGKRRGTMTKMVNNGSGRVRLEFRIPARGLIGFRSQFLTDTQGHRDHEPHLRELGAVARRDSGARRTACSSPTAPASRPSYAIFNLQERGEIFIDPATRSTKA